MQVIGSFFIMMSLIQKIMSKILLTLCICFVFFSCKEKAIIEVNQCDLFCEVIENIEQAKNKYSNQKILLSGKIDNIIYPIDSIKECTIIIGGNDYIFETTGDCIFCQLNERLEKDYENCEVKIICELDNIVKTDKGYYLIGLQSGQLVK